MGKPRSCFVWGRDNLLTSNPFTNGIDHSHAVLLRYFDEQKLPLNFAMHFRLDNVDLELTYGTTSPVSACTFCLSTQVRVGADSVCTRRDCPKVHNCARTTLFIPRVTEGLHARCGLFPATRAGTSRCTTSG